MLKKIVFSLLILGLIAAAVAYYGYGTIYDDNINDDVENQFITIPKGSSFADVVDILVSRGFLKDKFSFATVASLMSYDKEIVPSGKYKIEKNWSNRALISTLRAGRQAPINVTFNNHRTIEETLGDIASYLEVDSIAMVEYVLDQNTLKQLGRNREDILTLFVPNTYQMYWDISPEKLVARMQSEHEKFWAKKNREVKATKQNLTKAEVYTLASIVEKESQAAKERPIIAGLYLNRLEQSIPLQADPTVVYAVGDFGIRRVLNKHLAKDSPYNTYKYSGLPPGPIYLPSIESIDAVLNPTEHDYLFMCAKPGYNSEHAFAKTAAQHGRNARKYQNWLTSQGIRG